MTALLLIAALWAPDAGVAAAAADGGAPEAAKPLEPSGPPPKVEMTCAPQPVRVGDALTCTLVIDHRADVTVKVVAPSGAARKGEPTPAEPAPGGGLRSTRELVLKPFGLKDVKIRGFQVVWQETGGYEGRVDVPAIRVPVKSMLAGQAEPDFRTFAKPPEGDAEGFFSRHGPLPFVVTNWPLIIGLIVLGALLVGVGVGVAIKRWLAGREVDEGPFEDPRPAHVIAYERIERLQGEDLFSQGQAKQYYFRLSEIVRDYMGRRYGFDALEMTTEQIRAALQTEVLSVEAGVAVREFLEETDLVKFADFAPADDGGDTVLRMARGLIELTRAADVAPAAAPAPEGGA
ncbi:MAG: hypothetical protein H6702_15920 [Myxococcales bacterium]|nr:hypothetical protein [Myxococcales bacterium]